MRNIRSILMNLSQPAIHLVHTDGPSLSHLGGAAGSGCGALAAAALPPDVRRGYAAPS
jgi:hypothetical protein